MPVAKIKFNGVIEDLAEYFSDNSELGYTLATNFLIGDILDFQDIDQLIGSKIDLTVYDEGGILRFGSRFHTQERSLRFLVRDTYAQGAINKAHDIAAWFGDSRRLPTTNFLFTFMALSKFPGLVLAHDSGTYFADVVVTFLVLAKG